MIAIEIPTPAGLVYVEAEIDGPGGGVYPFGLDDNDEPIADATCRWVITESAILHPDGTFTDVTEGRVRAMVPDLDERLDGELSEMACE